MAINKDNVLDASWNNESLLQIRTALQELLNALGDSIDAAAGGNPASINMSVEGTVLTATVTLADGETELSSSVDLAGAISAAQVAVEIVNNLYTDSSSKALSAAMGVQLDRMSGTVLKHLHWVPGAAHALLAVGNHARYFEPEQGKIYHFYGYTPSGQGQPELGLDVYTPPAGIIFYDIETGSCYRFDGMDMVDILSSKANASEVAATYATKSELSGKQDTLTFDSTPTASSSNPVTSGGVKTAIDQVTPTIDANGKWVIGGVTTDKDAQGPRGNTVLVNENAVGIQALIVNNVSDGGETDILSAEMGKVLRQNIMKFFNALGTYAFPEGKPTLNWGSTVINHSINVNGVTGGLTIDDVEVDGVSAASLPAQVVEGKSLSLRLALPSNLYVFDDNVSVKIGGVDITNNTGVWDESTGVINIASVTDDVVITATALTYVQNGLVAMFDGKNVDSANNQWIDMKDNTRILELTNCTVQSDHVEFDGTNSYAVAPSTDTGINVEYNSGTIEAVFNGCEVASNKAAYFLVNHRYAPNGTFKRLIYLALTYHAVFNNGIGVHYYQTDADSSESASSLPKSWLLGKSSVATTDAIHLSVSDARAYLNGTSLNRASDKNYQFARSVSKLGVCYNINAQSEIFKYKGNAYCIRVYNTQLTADQVAQNYKVDQKRFNIQ